MRAPAAVILAAGRGTRMGPALPKVLHEVAGKPMLIRLLDAVEAAGVRDIVIVVGHRAPEVKRALKGRKVRFALQANPRGTGHAVLCARAALAGRTGPLLVLPGDAPLVRPETLKALLGDVAKGAACSILTAEIEHPAGYGRILRDAAGDVEGIVEDANATPAQKRLREVNSGIYAFDAAWLWPTLAAVPATQARKGREIYLTDVVAAAARSGRTVTGRVAADPAEAMGINTHDELACANAIQRWRLVSALMARGVLVADPSTTFIETEVPIGAGTVIHPFTVIRRGVRIGRDCQVGPFAHLREGTTLADGAEIGDFVETKKARLGRKAKAKHLAYLGNVTVGDGANIGAGTIVANYDGKAKHETVVGAGAFVGSGTVLVAPVRIGRRAMTGAGSVVTRGRNVPDGGVVVGVPARPLRKA